MTMIRTIVVTTMSTMMIIRMINHNNDDKNNNSNDTNGRIRPETHFFGCRLGWFPTMQKKKPRSATVALAQCQQCTQASV